MKNERVVELFQEFRAVLSGLDSGPKLATFPEFEGRRLYASAAAFRWLANAQTLALTNSVNEFAYYTQDLRAWEIVLSRLADHERFEAMLELVHPVAHFCLGSPYTLKVRFCRSIAQLSHQANEFAVDGWRDDERLSNPNFKTARRLAKRWSCWPPLEDQLARLNSDEFTASVYDFRNESQHGFPRSVEVGVTSFVRRERGETGVSYAFGVHPPLAIADALGALADQCDAALAVHRAYMDLVTEQMHIVVERCGVDA